MSHIHDKLLSPTNVRHLKYEVLMSKYFQHDLTVISNDNDPLALQHVNYFMALLKDPLLAAWKSLGYRPIRSQTMYNEEALAS